MTALDMMVEMKVGTMVTIADMNETQIKYCLRLQRLGTHVRRVYVYGKSFNMCIIFNVAYVEI